MRAIICGIQTTGLLLTGEEEEEEEEESDRRILRQTQREC